jgi:chromosome segregation ATPase
LVGGLRDLGGRLFPERQILLRSTEGVRSVLLPSWLQAMIIIACVSTFGAVSYLAVGYFSMHRELDRASASPSRNAAAVDLATVQKPSNTDTNAVAALNQQLASINQQYAALKQHYDAIVAKQSSNATATTQAQQDLQQKLDAAEQELSANSGNVTKFKKSVDELQANLKRSEQAHTAETMHAHELEAATQTLKAKILNLTALIDSDNQQLAVPPTQLTNSDGQRGTSQPMPSQSSQ